MKPLVGLALLAAASPVLAKDDPLAGRVAGAPVDCVTLSRLEGPAVQRDGTILYRESGRRVWQTRSIGHCPALRPLTTLVVQVFGAQLCRNDQFRVVEPGISIPSGVCRFDRFVPYDKPTAR